MTSSDQFKKAQGRLEKINTALICDVLDSLGVRESFAGPEIRPLWQGIRMAGIAVTLRCIPTNEVVDDPYSGLFKLFRIIEPGHVMVIEAGDQQSGIWGELLSVAAQSRGATGVIVDGLVRDSAAIQELMFPVFCRGASPLDSSGRQIAIDLQCKIRCGQVSVIPGDWVVADELGVVCIPARLVEPVIEKTEEKQRAETTVRRELETGEDISDVFLRHGIL